MHINEKRLAIVYGDRVTLHFNGWDISGRVENITSDNRVRLNGTYYNIRACHTITSDYNREVAIATENQLRQEGGLTA